LGVEDQRKGNHSGDQQHNGTDQSATGLGARLRHHRVFEGQRIASRPG
jgi:hypothetical protein